MLADALTVVRRAGRTLWLWLLLGLVLLVTVRPALAGEDPPDGEARDLLAGRRGRIHAGGQHALGEVVKPLEVPALPDGELPGGPERVPLRRPF